ncbi:MAG: hypothetical protein KDJ29_18840, partial [Hyphomicrobiales bacterium]|nr:hypothetical protein [Hyphomicrobiales bacterium]
PLQLFAKTEIDRSKGCSVALWQSNRDPDRNRYATAFFERISGRNYSRREARIKIANRVVRLQRIATGGKTSGYGLYAHQLYRLAGNAGFAVLDLVLQPIEGEAVEISGGSMTVTMRGKKPFTVKVRGGAGCFSAPANAASARAAAAPPSGGSGMAGMFSRYSVRPAQVPRSVLARVRKKYSCDPSMLKLGVTGFQMSEESAIWEFPCERFAASASSVYALVYLPNPSQNFSFLGFQSPKGRKRSAAPGTLIDPQWSVRRRTVTSISLGRRQGDCGTLERHRVTPEGSFKLIEYREKKRCGGKTVPPERFPLVYRSR